MSVVGQQVSLRYKYCTALGTCGMSPLKFWRGNFSDKHLAGVSAGWTVSAGG